MPFNHAVPFSSHQLQTLSAWGERRPCGLELRLATDHEELDEVVELFRPGQPAPAYCITAVTTGEVEIIDATDSAETVPTLESALTWVERQESSAPVSA